MPFFAALPLSLVHATDYSHLIDTSTLELLESFTTLDYGLGITACERTEMNKSMLTTRRQRAKFFEMSRYRCPGCI